MRACTLVVTMNFHRRLAPVLLCLIIGMAVPSIAQDRGVVLVDMPGSGQPGQIHSILVTTLEPLGFTVAKSGDEAAREPDAIVVYSDHAYDADDIKMLQTFVEEGGGLLLLYGSTTRHIAPANAILKPLGLELASVRTPRAAPRLLADSITTGVGKLPETSYRTAVRGENRKVLATQGEPTVAARATSGEGRIVVLPLDMVTADRDALPSADQARLLANACLWLMESQDEEPAVDGLPGDATDAAQPALAGNPSRPGAVEDRRPRPMRNTLERRRDVPSSDFGGAVLVDILAADDDWDLVAENLDKSLARLGLPVRYLQPVGQSPLALALANPPAMVVVSSTRRYDVDEALALAQYVGLGGRVLCLAHAKLPYTIRLMDFNTLLREYDVSVSLIREAGPTLSGEHPITDGLGALPTMPWGVYVWSRTATPVAKAGRGAFMVAWEGEQGGRVVVADGKVLLVGTRALRSPVKTGPAMPFIPLLDAAVDWLAEGRAQ